MTLLLLLPLLVGWVGLLLSVLRTLVADALTDSDDERW